MNIPANAGPIIVAKLIPIESNAMPFAMGFPSMKSCINDLREGISTDQLIPIIVIETYKCQYSIECVIVSKRRIEEVMREIIEVIKSIFFLGSWSANCPPKMPIINKGIVPKNATNETKNGEFVISSTIQFETIS